MIMRQDFFVLNDTATTEIYTLSLHDALPISEPGGGSPGNPPRSFAQQLSGAPAQHRDRVGHGAARARRKARSEEHTAELQSRPHLVCRLLPVKNENTPTILRVQASHLVPAMT